MIVVVLFSLSSETRDCGLGNDWENKLSTSRGVYLVDEALLGSRAFGLSLSYGLEKGIEIL